jgi:hypothetical protein
MTETINAFHPKFIETHYPELIKEGRIYSSKLVSGTVSGQKSKGARESIQGKNVNSILVFPKTKAKK